MVRSALDVVKSYIRDAWNEGKVELISELCADPVIRHDANSVTELTHAEQVERIAHNYDELRPTFEEVVFAGDDEYITLIWNVTGRDPNWKWCGIEIFRVVDGKISEVWNSPYLDGRWSMSRKLAARLGTAAETALPIMTLDMTETSAAAVVPVDARNIGRWIAQVLGAPVDSDIGNGLWQHRYAGHATQPFALAMRDSNGPSRSLDAVTVSSLRVEWARSGLINATIAVNGKTGATPPETPVPQAGHAVVRLVEPIGSFGHDGTVLARVVDSIIEVGEDAPKASGRVTLRVTGSYENEAALGTGALSFGWRAGDFSLIFEGTALLGAPENAFVDGGETEFSCSWACDRITATVVNDLAD